MGALGKVQRELIFSPKQQEILLFSYNLFS